MSRVIAGIGIPGSGKSTSLLQYAREHSYAYISPDELRQEISGDVRIQSDMRLVWETAFLRLKEALERGETVVFDATQYKPVDRRDFADKAKSYGATEIVGVYFNVPLDTAKERNVLRARTVPEHALERMRRLLQEYPPSVADGFTAIISPDELT
ncbi:MAG TPA: AAA family ATPase [Candidatus Paceibacterota bacterium]|nr:AAA family ATPase [Candidatus Paceibacterota bacterium]